MSWANLQIGKKKALKRCPWRDDDWYKSHPDTLARHLGVHRKTTKRCSAAIHGCGHLRDLEGDTYQERKMKEQYSLDMPV